MMGSGFTTAEHVGGEDEGVEDDVEEGEGVEVEGGEVGGNPPTAGRDRQSATAFSLPGM